MRVTLSFLPAEEEKAMTVFAFLKTYLHPRIRVTVKPDGRKVIYLTARAEKQKSCIFG